MPKNIISTNNTLSAKRWQDVSWVIINERVKVLRGQIYKAKKRNNIQLVRRLQNVMLNSDANILLSIRKVTSINVGKKTPGLDKMLVKSNEGRWALFTELQNLPKNEWAKIAKPAKRLYIPKPNGKLRPLGIPTIKDRVIQNMVKNALEPEWEATFESMSYGFRPSRSAHDALARVYSLTARHKKRVWVLDADIKGCFDNIDHTMLLTALEGFPAKDVIEAWLKAGYCEFPNLDLIETTAGTPQGGIISPLLANIAMHGMEKELDIKTDPKTGHSRSTNTFAVVRYADDFVVLCQNRKDCERAYSIMEKWLANRGLEFAPDKVNITHLRDGIKFLGCKIKLYGEKNPKLLITPHPEKVKAHKEKLREIWLRYKGQAPQDAIKELNPIIRGWANYYRPYVSSEIFSDLDHFMWHRAWRYAKRRHPQKNHEWIADRYFGRQKGPSSNKWRFFATINKEDKVFLLKYSDFKIRRHVLVLNTMCPDDRSQVAIAYWQKREANKQHIKWGGYESRLKLAKMQYHICPMCEESLYNGEELHVHHLKAKKDGGKDTYNNLIILHDLCHRQVHSLKLTEHDVRSKYYSLKKKMKTLLDSRKTELPIDPNE